MPKPHKDFVCGAALFMGLAGFALAAAIGWSATGSIALN